MLEVERETLKLLFRGNYLPSEIRECTAKEFQFAGLFSKCKQVHLPCSSTFSAPALQEGTSSKEPYLVDVRCVKTTRSPLRAYQRKYEMDQTSLDELLGERERLQKRVVEQNVRLEWCSSNSNKEVYQFNCQMCLEV